jgi:hypothetical protein
MWNKIVLVLKYTYILTLGMLLLNLKNSHSLIGHRNSYFISLLPFSIKIILFF